MEYNYTKIYNEDWQDFMNRCDIESIGIIRRDKDGKKLFGFSNVFSDSVSPYDFCARIGLSILENLYMDNVEKLEISKGCYVFADKLSK